MPRRIRGTRRGPTAYGDVVALDIMEPGRWVSGDIRFEGQVIGASHEEDGRRRFNLEWKDWAEWAATYEVCRRAFLAERHRWPHRREPVSERLYQAILEGGDPDAIVAEAHRQRYAWDPRDALEVE